MLVKHEPPTQKTFENARRRHEKEEKRRHEKLKVRGDVRQKWALENAKLINDLGITDDYEMQKELGLYIKW